jgi:hypothetical protein
MVMWTMISALSLAPYCAVFLGLATRGNLPTLAELIGRGELLINTVLLCAGCALELVTGQSSATRTQRMLAGGASLFILVIAALYYAQISSDILSGIGGSRPLVPVVSLCMYGSALIVGGRCIFLSEAR